MRRLVVVGLVGVVCALGPACKNDGAAPSGGGGGGGPAAGGARGPGGGKGGPGGGRGPVSFPVETTTVEARDVEYSVGAVGSVEAFERVQITARVAGVVEQVHFTEGQEVKKGTLLAEIEPTRYQLAVDSARAALEKARAAAADAQASLERREAVNQSRPGLLPAEEVETFRTRARSAQAEASAARAALSQAELNLRDAHVRAPMDGTLQTRTIQTGQYVQPGAVMATLLRRDPLLLRFTVPESDGARIKPGMVARFQVGESATETFRAAIKYVAESAESASRMVPVTAEVLKEDAGKLRPGAFARVRVPVGSSGGSPVIPQTAVRPSERGFLTFVVEGDKARERIIELGLRTDDGRVEVKKGLREGEQLVVRGAEALRDGASVRVAQGPTTPVKGEAGQAAPGADAGAGPRPRGGGATP